MPKALKLPLPAATVMLTGREVTVPLNVPEPSALPVHVRSKAAPRKFISSSSGTLEVVPPGPLTQSRPLNNCPDLCAMGVMGLPAGSLISMPMKLLSGLDVLK